MEFGTKEFHYRTMKPMICEMVNFNSKSEIYIKIWTTSVYIQNKMMNLINISSAPLSTHPDYAILGKRAIIVPTAIPQPELIEKSRFMLLNNFSTDFSNIFTEEKFTNLEIDFLNLNEYGIATLSTSLSLINIDFYQEEITTQLNFNVIAAINLHDKTMSIGK